MKLRQAAFSAGRWTMASMLLRTLLQVAQTMVLARLLTPADFGVMAIAAAVLAIISSISEMGLSQALIYFQRPDRDALSTLYWLNLGVACVLMLVLDALAWSLAALYRQPELLGMMLVLGLALPATAAGQQFRVLAERELRFRILAWIEVAVAMLSFGVALTLAICHAKAYALAGATLAGALTSSLLAWLLLSAKARPARHFNINSVKTYLRYGTYRLGDALIINVNSQMDVLVGGALAGAAGMGTYTVPRNQSQILATALINPVVSRVILPLMAKVQSDKNQLKSIYLQALRMTSSINFPLYLALVAWADEVVAILLGPQWGDATWFLRVFAIWGLIRSVGSQAGTLLYSTGKVRLAFWWNLTLMLVTPGLLAAAILSAGVRGLALALLGTQVLLFYPSFRFFVQGICGASLREFMHVLWPPLLASIMAVMLGLKASQLLSDGELTRLVCGGLLAASLYFVLSYAINRPWFTAMQELLGLSFKSVRSKDE